MYEISDISVVECSDSKYIALKRFVYKQSGKPKSWDLAIVHDSVAVLLYNADTDSFVFVKQFRPPVFLKDTDGFTYELCAGIVDKDMSIEDVAREEILEECGYAVSIEKIEHITSFYTSVGFAGSKQTLFFAKVNAWMKVEEGGGIEDEAIEIFELPVSKAREFMFDENIPKTPGLMFAVMWYLDKAT